MKLRNYQEKAVSCVLQDIADGYRRLMVAMATGTGKTHTGLAIAYEFLRQHPEARILWIAHRKELIDQPYERAVTAFQGLLPTPGIVMADSNQVDAQVVIASIQTLYNRADDLLKHGGFGLIIYDETHHIKGIKNEATIKKLMASDTILIGLTATPKRSDGLAMGDMFEKVSYRLTLLQAINLGILVPLVAKGAVLPGVDFSKIRTVAGDYSEKQMADLINASNWLEVVFNKWAEEAHDLSTLAFTVDVQSAHALADYFQHQGIQAAAIDGTTPKQQREQILNDYQAGRVQVVVNCMVLTEGFDAPKTECILMCRPTKSDSLYIQVVGRGLRTADNKTKCLVIDFAPANARDLIQAGDLLAGQPREQRAIQAKAKDEDVIMDVFGFRSKQLGLDVPPDEVELFMLNYMVAISRLAWLTDGKLSVATLGNNHVLAITNPQPELCRIMQAELQGLWKHAWNYIGTDFVLYEIKGHQIVRLGYDPDFSVLAEKAENHAQIHATDTLAIKGRPWRKKAASDKQQAFCERLGVWQPDMTAGQAARAITLKLTENKLREARRLV